MKTIGVVRTSARTTAVTRSVLETSTSGVRLVNSARAARTLSAFAAGKRTSMWILRPSSQPSFWSACQSAATGAWAARSSSASPISTPPRRIRSGCCARAVSGQVAAALPSIMNSRRLIRSPRRRVIFPCDGHSAISDGVGVFRIELEHLVEVLNSPIVLALAYVGETAIVEGIGIVWIKLDRQVEVLNGAVNLADLVVSITTIIKGNGLVRIELDRLVVVLDGAIILALSEVGVAAIADGFDVVRIEFDCLVVVLDGAVP